MARYDEDDDEGHIDMRPLFRIATWGVCSVVAVGAVIFAGRTEVGAERAGVAMAALRDAPNDLIAHPSNLLATSAPGTDAETRRLADTVRKLSADRDRLASRVAALEQNLNDLTGSGPRGRAAAPPAPRPRGRRSVSRCRGQAGWRPSSPTSIRPRPRAPAPAPIPGSRSRR